MLNAQNFQFEDLSLGHTAHFDGKGLHVEYYAPLISFYRNSTF